ncbi:hypothetical protein DRO29_07620 [Candidatus Bathyarchaeota archaeon]|nr:MAG: hypothetical protein DRO29_07620 [Candidatus Bathyarchaeota archaeon]
MLLNILRAFGELGDGFLHIGKNVSREQQVTIRKAFKRDLPSVAEVAKKAFSGKPDSYWAVVGFKRAQRVYVAEVGEKLIGVIEIEVIRLRNGRHGHIGYIFVDPAFQGRGIGKKLVKKAEEFFFSKNAIASWALTDEDNIVARKMFRSLDYQELDVEDVIRELGEEDAEKLLRRMIYWTGDIILRKKLV